tara:strand:- start:499 stop:1065 length:567 start_codon:yes stop_codon:yes gene_type:complete
MADAYDVTEVTTNNFLVGGNGILDAPNVFPPDNLYKLLISPRPGYDLSANEFKIGLSNVPAMKLARDNAPNSQTKWPSRFEWRMEDLNQPASTPSGVMEFDGIYKVVIEDSTNPNNLPSWSNPGVGNFINVWIYFGENETTPADSLNNLIIDLDIDRQVSDPLTQADTTSLLAPGRNNIDLNINTISI